MFWQLTITYGHRATSLTLTLKYGNNIYFNLIVLNWRIYEVSGRTKHSLLCRLWFLPLAALCADVATSRRPSQSGANSERISDLNLGSTSHYQFGHKSSALPNELSGGYWVSTWTFGALCGINCNTDHCTYVFLKLHRIWYDIRWRLKKAPSSSSVYRNAELK